MAKKTWKEKLNIDSEPVVKVATKALAGIPLGCRMLIPTPLQVDAYLRAIPRGQEKTLQQMRVELAQQNGADTTCPVCSGIFLRISSEAANEELVEGAPLESVTPFWRMIQPKAPIRKKISFPVSVIDDFRRAEGLAV